MVLITVAFFANGIDRVYFNPLIFGLFFILFGMPQLKRMTASKACIEEIKGWMSENKVKEIGIEYRYFRKGPFKKASTYQLVYLVTVQNVERRREEYWFCFGHWFWGGFKPEMQVKREMS